MAEAPDDAIDRLYGLALEEFIPARDALSRELRDSGRRGEATAVKALKKPTVAAWAVNQAVRSQPRAARELWDAGDALAAAQEAVLSGKGSGADLREAAERERMAVDPLVDAARGLLTSSGGDLSATTIDRVRSTLQAAAIDPDARDEVAAGRATREREPRGLFGGDEGAAPAAPARPGGTAKRDRPADRPARRRSAGSDGTEEKPTRGRSATRGRSTRGRSAGSDGTEEKRARGRSGRSTRGRSAEPDLSAAERERAREEQAAARKREREEAAARDRARKAAAARVARAENALAAAEARSAKAAEQLEDARAREREAVEALADARAELRALER
ncbi:MAG: hypothetical protein V7607_664 [Solirubrobacteraceae bacterium]